MIKPLILLTLLLVACATQPAPQPITPITPAPAPRGATSPIRQPQYGYLEVCVDGLNQKLHSYTLEAGGQRMWLTLAQPCQVLTDELTQAPLALPAGATYEIVARDGGWGLRASPNYQTATIVGGQTVTARVKVGYP